VRFLCKRHPGYTLHVKDPEMDWRDPTHPRQIRPAVVADFSESGIPTTFSRFDPEKGTLVEGTETVLSGGGYLDTDEAARMHGWSPEEKALVEERLLELTRTDKNGDPVGETELRRRSYVPGFGDVELYTEPKPVAPWPTYDGMHHSQIAAFAENAGLVREALEYESRTKRRQSVLDQLAEKVDAEDALTAA
jgi:hypothetical protein